MFPQVKQHQNRFIIFILQVCWHTKIEAIKKKKKKVIENSGIIYSL